MKTTFYTGKGETAPRSLTLKYELWSYDVWGNARDGFEVNDRSRCGTVSIRCRPEVCNAGTEHEFTIFVPTDRQLARAIGATGCVYDWHDSGFYIEEKRNGKPVGELVLISQEIMS